MVDDLARIFEALGLNFSAPPPQHTRSGGIHRDREVGGITSLQPYVWFYCSFLISQSLPEKQKHIHIYQW